MLSSLRAGRLGVTGLLLAIPLAAQTPVGNPQSFTFKSQPYQRPEACLPCHQRQYNELRQSVKSGYRNVSPLFNGLEMAANLLSGGRLRPVYGDSTKLRQDGQPFGGAYSTAEKFEHVNQVQAGICLGCHNIYAARLGENPATREVPEANGLGADFLPETIRPLRDYHLVDASGHQILPAEPGGPPPPGARPSLGAAGITCDLCHNVVAPSIDRSFQRDGFANTSLELLPSISKVGSFFYPVAVRGNFHVSSQDKERIEYLRSPTLCNGCHDVRIPGAGNLMAFETNVNDGGAAVTHYRLENLSTEWAVGAYNSTSNPFGKVIRCQDCHMSLFPYAGNSTYPVGGLTVTSPTPAVMAENFAAVPGVATAYNAPLQKRQVSTHYMTGVDVPIMGVDELRARLGADYPDPLTGGPDEYGHPTALKQRREDLLKAAVRIYLDKSDKSVQMGGTLNVRVTCIALTGHRFPAGFSQERTTYINLTVKDRNGFLLYQSGYLVDKPHPDTGEMEPDGNLDDEDQEHVIAVVDPGRRIVPYQPGNLNNGHTNQVFTPGPDNGSEARVYIGRPAGLVMFRNELTRIFLPGPPANSYVGRLDGEGNPVQVTRPHFEETFSAAFANAVDNFRSLQPLRPTTFRYEIHLPSEHELEELGVHIEGPLQVHAQVDYEHFPPLFLRFLTRVTGENGPTGRNLNLLNEKTIDTYLRNNRNIASAELSVDLTR
jgi:hypothetical protein